MRLRLARSAEAHPPLLDERDAPYAVPEAAQQEGTAASRTHTQIREGVAVLAPGARGSPLRG